MGRPFAGYGTAVAQAMANHAPEQEAPKSADGQPATGNVRFQRSVSTVRDAREMLNALIFFDISRTAVDIHSFLFKTCHSEVND